jgi:MtN3 and saliva related transmembrane protein
MSLDQLLGWIATILFTICYIPQIIVTIRTKTIDGLSISLFVIQLLGNIIALIYSVMIWQPPLLVKYVVAIGMLVIVLAVIWHCSRNR